MDHMIKKERIHLFSPSANICVIARINGIIEPPELEKAIRAAVNSHQILCSRVVLQEDGSAFWVPLETGQPAALTEYAARWEDAAAAQEQTAFRIDRGETMRFFHSYRDGQTELLVIAHHIVGDGGSLMIFMDDVLKALNRQPVKHSEIQLLTENDLPKHPKLGLFLRAMLRHTNSRWSKTGSVFSFDAFDRMFAEYAAAHRTSVLVKSFDSRSLDALLGLAHAHSITLNSLLVTAFAAAGAADGMGVAVNIRPKGFEGMGNYATGVSIRPEYSAQKDFFENAANIHRKLKGKLNSPGKKYFLYEFMNALAPTLIDSIYFSLTGLYANPISESIRKMCGYTEPPTGTSMTNLTSVQTSESEGQRYSWEALFFVPPYIPNAARVIGASTCRRRLTLTSHFPESSIDSERSLFDRACKLLDELAG